MCVCERVSVCVREISSLRVFVRVRVPLDRKGERKSESVCV